MSWNSLRYQKPPTKRELRRRSCLNGHALPLCMSGKLRYRDRKQAQDALTLTKHQGARARGHGETTNRREWAYPCRLCNGWHLTSRLV